MEREPLHARLTAAEPDYLAAADARGLVRREVAPDPPKWTFFSGVFTFPWQGVNRVRWTAMSFGLSVVLVLAWHTAQLLGVFGGLGGQALMGIPLSMVTIAMALATFSLCAACLLAAVQDTADGHHDPLESGMPEWNEWLFSLISMSTLWGLAAALGTPFMLIEEVGPVACLISGLLVFPILLLSAMEADSFLVPYSPTILVDAWLFLARLVRFLLARGSDAGGMDLCLQCSGGDSGLSRPDFVGADSRGDAFDLRPAVRTPGMAGIGCLGGTRAGTIRGNSLGWR